MTKRNEIYKCESCGNIVEVLHAGGGQLVCCGKPMTVQPENTVDASVEKHTPVVTKVADGYNVKVGSIEHPMDEAHYIEWIELITETEVLRVFLQPGQAPDVTFKTAATVVSARAYCNLHGNWKA